MESTPQATPVEAVLETRDLVRHFRGKRRSLLGRDRPSGPWTESASSCMRGDAWPCRRERVRQVDGREGDSQHPAADQRPGFLPRARHCGVEGGGNVSPAARNADDLPGPAGGSRPADAHRRPDLRTPRDFPGWYGEGSRAGRMRDARHDGVEGPHVHALPPRAERRAAAARGDCARLDSAAESRRLR